MFVKYSNHTKMGRKKIKRHAHPHGGTKRKRSKKRKKR